jgi:hypothetical protein
VSLTSSEYHYSSFSELLDLHYFKNLSISAPIFSKKKPLCLSDFVAKTIFAKQKQNTALSFQKNALSTLPLPAGRFSASTLLNINFKNEVFLFVSN